MTDQEIIEIRNLRNGDWYWIHKAVIQKYGLKVGAIGIAVYNFLASLADRNRACFPSQRYISERLGYSRSYVNETLKLLERNGLIKIEKKGSYRRIYHLLKLRCQLERTQVSTIANRGVNQSDNNNNKLTRIIKNIDIDNKNLLDENPKPNSREELLALDLAQALKDRSGFSLYLSYAKKYPESLLRKILGEVKEIPDHKIKKSRGALFNYLIQKHDQKTVRNHRN
jgi:DNA-binding MarR family transcriptional regulator